MAGLAGCSAEKDIPGRAALREKLARGLVQLAARTATKAARLVANNHGNIRRSDLDDGLNFILRCRQRPRFERAELLAKGISFALEHELFLPSVT